MEAKKEIFTAIDSKTRKYIDEIIKEIFTENTEKAVNDEQELTDRLCTQISYVSFYAFHELTDGIFEGRCEANKLTGALVSAAKLKAVLWSCDLMTLKEEERECFFRDLWMADTVARSVFTPDALSGLESGSRTFYGFIYILLCSYSNDMLPMYFNYPFKLPIHISCGHCGNNIHSVLVAPEEMTEDNKSKMQPRIYDGDTDGFIGENIEEIMKQERICESENAEGYGEPDYDEWDIYNANMRYLQACGEEYLTTVLPYLYGSHICGKCGKPETVIKSAVSFIYQQQEVFDEPREELIKWLAEYALSVRSGKEQTKDEENVDFSYFLMKMAVWYEKSRKQPDLHRMYENIIELYRNRNARIVPINVKKLQYCIRSLENTGEAELLAKAYGMLSADLRSDFKDDDRNRYDLSYEAAKRGLEVLKENNMMDSPLYRNLIVQLSIIVAESEEGDVQEAENKLLELIEEEKQKAEPDTEEIGELYNKLAYMFANRVGDYDKTYEYYGYYMEEIRRIYGSDSDMEADCLEELAEYHEMADDAEGACKLREQALEINIREMGKLYTLPPIFKGIAIAAAKAAGAIDEDDKFNRVMSASDSYIELAEEYSELGRDEEALDCRQKALSLLEWQFKGKMPDPRTAELHREIGDYYDENGKNRKAKKEWQQAKEICNAVIKESIYDDEVETCRELLEELEDML